MKRVSEEMMTQLLKNWPYGAKNLENLRVELEEWLAQHMKEKPDQADGWTSENIDSAFSCFLKGALTLMNPQSRFNRLWSNDEN